MKNKLKILYINPGIMEIPPKSWGAVEKIIWNYKVQLEKLGHSVDIKVPWEINDKYDITHCHISNQCNVDLQKISNKDYIFSLHDHHSYYWGKESTVYKENLKSIKNSTISLTHAEYLMDYFDTTDKLFYLQHGVDTNIYIDKGYKKDDHKLLCVANNGLVDHPTIDRKGFRLAIESAKSLDLPITIVGPKDNRKFFDANKDLLNYKKLNIIEDPNESELIEIYNNHTMFVHLSNLEAGHPNLTILESLSCGLPVIGTYLGKDGLGGLVKCELFKSDIINKIKYTIDNYNELKSKSKITSKKYDWEIIVKKLEQIYYNVIDIKRNFTNDLMSKEIIRIYNETPLNYTPPLIPKVDIEQMDFNYGAKMVIKSPKGEKDDYSISFIDKKKDQTIFNINMKNGQWSKTNRKWYTDWSIKIHNRTNDTIKFIDMDLKYKNVHIKLDNDSSEINKIWIPYVDEFRKKHDCVVYCSTKFNSELEKDFNDIFFIKNDNYVNTYASYIIKNENNREITPRDTQNLNPDEIIKDILGLWE